MDDCIYEDTLDGEASDCFCVLPGSPDKTEEGGSTLQYGVLQI